MKITLKVKNLKTFFPCLLSTLSTFFLSQMKNSKVWFRRERERRKGEGGERRGKGKKVQQKGICSAIQGIQEKLIKWPKSTCTTHFTILLPLHFCLHQSTWNWHLNFLLPRYFIAFQIVNKTFSKEERKRGGETTFEKLLENLNVLQQQQYPESFSF